jgi:hypothetical protein
LSKRELAASGDIGTVRRSAVSMWYDGDLMVLDQTANGGDGGVDYEQVLSEALVNEGAHTKVRLP